MLATVVWSRSLFRPFLLALMLMGLLLAPTYAFTTGQSASLVVGQNNFSNGSANEGGPTNQTSLHSPEGLAFDAAGNLWAVDSYNNRVLMFKPPFTTGMPASLVIGQADFVSFAGAISLTGLNTPEQLGFDLSGDLWVADWQSNRVLMFKPPFTTGMPASLVIGQTDFTHALAATSQTGLYLPRGLGFDATGNLWIADQGNNRVLMFKPPFTNGMAASLVIGHKSFSWGGAVTAPANQTGLNLPAALSFDSGGNLWVADTSNNRVLMFKPAFATDMPASLVVGQSTFTGNSATTTKTGLDQPFGLGFDSSGNLWVSDSINCRVLKFVPPFANGMPANLVIGQTDFVHGGGSTSQTGFQVSVGLTFDLVGNLWVSDVNNNRVLMFAGSTGLSGFLLELQPGWNLISLPVIPAQTAIGKLLLPLIQLKELVVVWSYTPGASPSWASFTPPSPSTCTPSATKLCSMVDGKGYWVRVNDAVNMTVAGYVIPVPPSVPPTYSLSAGWNLFGFKPQPLIQNETVATYLASISTKYSSIWVYDNLNATWIRGTPGLVLAPGEGMWIYMTTPATLFP